MQLQCIYSAIQVLEDVFVGRENNLHREAVEAIEGTEVVSEGIPLLVGVQADVGRDLRENVVAGEQDPFLMVMKADVLVRVPGSPECLQRRIPEFEELPIV